MAKPRVLQLIGSFETGGTELQSIKLARALSTDGTYEISIACLDKSGPLKQLIDWIPIDEIPEFRLTSFYDLNFINRTIEIGRYIRERKIDLVHTHDFYTNIFGMFGAALSAQCVRIASKRSTLSKSASQLIVERQSFRLAKKIVANSEAVRTFLIDRNVPPEKIVTIYNGLDLARFTNAATIDRESFFRSLGIEIGANPKFVTIVANMRSDVKNHQMFLRAAKRIRERIDSAEFLLAGEGELRENLIDRANELGIGDYCHFVGSAIDIPSLLSVSEIGVLTSRSEGFSNAIIEYMAAGLPVVATDVGGAKEAIEDGETGYLVRSDDDEALSACIIKILEDKALSDRLGQRGKEIAFTRFSAERQTDSVLSLYESVLKDR